MARNQLAKLYKQLLSECNKFSDYNFRSHALRRMQYKYEKHLDQTDESTLNRMIETAQNDLGQIQRQVTVGDLYRAERHCLDPKQT